MVTSNDGKGQRSDRQYRYTAYRQPIAWLSTSTRQTTHHVIQQTGIMNVNCLSTEAPFSVFQQFGSKSGRSTDKFAGQKVKPLRQRPGIPRQIYQCFHVPEGRKLCGSWHSRNVHLQRHRARVMSDQDTMTSHLLPETCKTPKPQTEGKKAGYAKSADTSMKAMNFRRYHLPAVKASMALWILSRSKDKTEIPIT